MNLKELRRRTEQIKGQYKQVENDLLLQKKSLRKKKRNLEKYEQAKEIIREVGIKTQQQLQFHIADITSMALEAVFPKPYKLEIEFVQRRNKTECDIYFSRNGNRIDPVSASGGGAVDIASFALRIASWSLERPHSRNTIILDEPLKWIDESLKDKASAMIKQVSKKLGIQFIIITHDPELASYADKEFKVKIKNGISKIT